MPRNAEQSADSSAGEEEESAEEESIAATRPRREPRAPQSIYVAPTELRKRKTPVDTEQDERNRRRRERRKRARESRDLLQQQQQQRQSAGTDETMAEAEQDDDEQADDGGRSSFMAAPRAKRRKSLYGARRKQRHTSSTYASEGAEETDSARDSVGTHSDDERRQQEDKEDKEDSRRRRRRGGSSSSEPPIVIHIRVRLAPGRDHAGKFCGIRTYQLDRITGVQLPPPSRQQRQQSPRPQRNGHSPPPLQHYRDDEDDDHIDHAQQQPHIPSDHTDSDGGAARNMSSSRADRGRKPRRESVNWQLPNSNSTGSTSSSKPNKHRSDIHLPVLHVTPAGQQLYGVLPDATLVTNARGKLAPPSTFDFSVFRSAKKEHDIVVKKEEVEAEDGGVEAAAAVRQSTRRGRSSSVGPNAHATSAATTRSAYAHYSSTNSSTADHHSSYNSYYNSSPVSSSHHSFDAAAESSNSYVRPPPPATFPPSPPASPPVSPRLMHTMRSMPSLEYHISNVRAGTHPLYLSALEQIDRLRAERQQAVERLKRERLQHVDDQYAAETKQVEEEWKDEARGLQARIIDQLTTQHRHSHTAISSLTHPDNLSSLATTRMTRRRHHLLPTHHSRTVLKRYHAEYCLPVVERRADVERCRRLIEDALGEEEGGDILKRLDGKLERRRERYGSGGLWRRAHQLRNGEGWGGGGSRHAEELAARADAAVRRTRGSDGRFQ